MRVVFINPSQEMGGIQALSAFIRQYGHEAFLVQDPRLFENPWIQYPRLEKFFDVKSELLDQVLSFKPDLVALSVVADDFIWANEWSKRIKAQLDVPIVYGNIGPTVDPMAPLLKPYVDFIVRGEGEFTLQELLEYFEGKRNLEDILGLGYKVDGKPKINDLRPLIEDLDILPFPDKDLYYDRYPYFNFGYTTMTGRGCPYHCSFCDNTTASRLYRDEAVKKVKWARRHSPEYVIREIKWAKEKYNINHVRFNDEDFSYSKKWVKEFCELYKKSGINLPWFAWVYPNTIDQEIADLMADAGCDSVEMGVQSGSKRLRDEIMKRRTSDESIVNAVQAFNRVGIRCTVDIIVGVPTETKEDLDNTVRLLSAARPYHIYGFWLRYYESTEITQMAVENHWLSEDQLRRMKDKEHTRGHLGGGTEIEKNSVTRSYHTFITLLPILPMSFVNWMLKHDLIRHFPCFLNPIFLVNFTKLFRENSVDEFRVRTFRMYLKELPWIVFCSLRKKKFIRSILGGKRAKNIDKQVL